jgi:hypothetical protein
MWQANPCDDCVFKAKKRGVQVANIMHVDDLMVSSVNKDNGNDVKVVFEKAEAKVNVQRGQNFDYLGIIFEYCDEEYIAISMYDLVLAVVKDLNLRPTSSATTQRQHLYDVNHESKKLSYHSCLIPFTSNNEVSLSRNVQDQMC